MATVLLRVRLPSGATLKIRVPPTTTHQTLLAEVLTQAAVTDAGLDADACSLSLNRKTALGVGPSAPVSEIGVTNGDLIYLIITASAASDMQLEAPVGAPALPVRPATAAVPASPATNAAAAAMARANPAAAAASDASSAALLTLLEMGFAEDDAAAALASCGGKLDEAATLLAASVEGAEAEVESAMQVWGKG